MSQVARSTLWNIAGTAAPAVAAFAAIPFLLRGLGTERFGLLAIAWAVLNYVLLFNLGLGRASVWRLVQARDDITASSEIAWASLLAHLGLGGAGWLTLLLLAEPLARDWLHLGPDLEAEAVRSFRVLGAAVPVLLLTLALRAMLEARQRFDLVNLVQIPAAAFNYIGPLCVLPWTRRLDAILLALLAARVVAAAVHAVQVWRVLPAVRRVRLPGGHTIRSLVGPGAWLTVLTATLPLVAVVDRLAVGRLVSVEAVTWYAIPYEIVSRCWIFSASLLRALFPRLTELGEERRAEIALLHRRALKLVLAAVAPLALALSISGHELLRLWLGAQAAAEGARVLQLLVFGLVASSAAAVPSTVLTTAGRASWAGAANLVQWLAYGGLCLGLTAGWGITGTAAAWSVRAAADLIVMLMLGSRFLGSAVGSLSIPLLHWVLISAALFAALPLAWLEPDWLTALAGVATVAGMGSWFWLRVIEPSDRLLLGRLLGRAG